MVGWQLRVNAVSFESQALTKVSQKHKTVLIGAVESKESGMVQEVLTCVKDNLPDEEVRDTSMFADRIVKKAQLHRYQLTFTRVNQLAPPIARLYEVLLDYCVSIICHAVWVLPNGVSLEPSRVFGRHGTTGGTRFLLSPVLGCTSFGVDRARPRIIEG